jgi:hypothetical protein
VEVVSSKDYDVVVKMLESKDKSVKDGVLAVCCEIYLKYEKDSAKMYKLLGKVS